MPLSPIGASGIQAFQAASQRVNDAASRIASATASSSQQATELQATEGQAPSGLNDITSAIVDLNVAEQQAGAAAKIIETENNVIGTLLDTFA
jgi:hypothetical protein